MKNTANRANPKIKEITMQDYKAALSELRYEGGSTFHIMIKEVIRTIDHVDGVTIGWSSISSMDIEDSEDFCKELSLICKLCKEFNEKYKGALIIQ